MPRPCMTLRFRGVRGSLPTPTPANLRYGGNTTCLELVLSDGQIILIDAGTGIRGLGLELAARGDDLKLTLLLTHFHWDHIQGIPFFTPLYNASNRLELYSPRTPDEAREILEGQMAAPLFPVPFDCLAALRNFIAASEPFDLGAARVTPFRMNHPQGALGYRIDCGGHSIVHACDHEPGNQAIDDGILRVAAGADLLICDAQYTPEEYERRRGWGHGTWLSAARMAQAAQVKQLALTHHDPEHDDDFVDAMLANARREFPATIAAAEGVVMEFGG